MSNPVLLIAGSTNPASLVQALTDRGFEARLESMAPPIDAIRAGGFSAIVILASAEPPTAAVTALQQGLSGACPPVIVALAAPSSPARDQSIIAGATDVAMDGHPAELAGRVHSAVKGWLRGTPRRNLRGASFRAQRGRQFVQLKAVDIDPTGFGTEAIEGLPPGTLLRTSVVLPDGELLAWGRLTRVDGGLGVRFLGLTATERARIVAACEGRGAEPAVAQEPPTSPSPPPPVMAPAPDVAVPGFRSRPSSLEAVANAQPRSLTSIPVVTRIPASLSGAGPGSIPPRERTRPQPSPASMPPGARADRVDAPAREAPARTSLPPLASSMPGNGSPRSNPPREQAKTSEAGPVPGDLPMTARAGSSPTATGPASMAPRERTQAPPPPSIFPRERTRAPPQGQLETKSAPSVAPRSMAPRERTMAPTATSSAPGADPQSRPPGPASTPAARGQPPSTAPREQTRAPAPGTSAGRSAPSITGRPAPRLQLSEPAAGGAPSGVVGPAPAPEPAPPPPSAGALAIADAIGSLLTEVETSPLPAEGAAASPGPQTPADLRAWPPTTFDAEASVELLREATTLGLAADREGAPSAEVTLAFVRTLTLTEQHAFAPEPPAELPDAALAIKCLTLRLRLFALADAATRTIVKPGEQILVDDEALLRLSSEVNAVNAELQKVIDRFLASGEAQRIKEVNSFRNALTRGQSDLRAAVARMRGEATARSNISLLDVDTHAPGEAAPPVRREPSRAAEPQSQPAKPKHESGIARELTGKERERRRIILWVMLIVVLSPVSYFMYPVKSRLLTGAELAQTHDLTEVTISEATHRARIITKNAWLADPGHLGEVQALLQKFKIESYVVVNEAGQALVFQHPGKPIVVTLAGRPKK